MIEATTSVNSEATEVPDLRGAKLTCRTCVGCNERVDVRGPGNADLVRLILGPGGEIAVDSKGGGFGRGAHVHARRACVERAARAGLLRATKGTARLVYGADPGQSDKGEPLSTDSLARAIQVSMDRRIEGLLAAAVRSRQVARGADAVTGACRRDEARLVLVARDAAAAADLTEVRRAVAEGRAVAWGTKERLGAIVAPAAVRGRLAAPPVTMGETPNPPAPQPPPVTPGETLDPLPAGAPAPAQQGSGGVGVVAISSRTIAEALRTAVQAASAVTSREVATAGASPQIQAGSQARPRNPRQHRRGERGPSGPGGARRARDRHDG